MLMSKLVFFSSLLVIAILSYLISSFEFLLIAIIALTFIFLVFAGLIHLLKKLNAKYFKIPSLILVICIFGIGVSLFRPYEKAVTETGTLSEKLKYAYETDQKDRKQLRSFLTYFSDLENRDDIRLAQVKELRREDTIKKALDKFYAGFIYHHSDNSSDYKIASKLASEAAESASLKDNYQVQWLRKATYDRYLLSKGKQEKYNTQNSFSIDFE